MPRYSRYEEDPGGPARERRRGGGNEGLFIALAIAGVVGIVLIFMISGGASGDDEVKIAQDQLEVLLTTFVKDEVKRGSAMVDPRQILGSIATEKMESFETLTPAEQQDFREQAWRFVQHTVRNELDLVEASQVPGLMSGMQARWIPSQREVHMEWTHMSHVWRARLRKEGESFVLLDLKQVSI